MNRLAPLPSAALLAAFLLIVPSTAAAQLAGPNTFGYTIDTAPYDYVAPPSGLDPLGDPIFGFGDDEEETIALPWSFPFYGVDYTSVIVGANGGVRFTAGEVGLGSCLPASFGAADIAAYWDDLDPSLASLLGGGLFVWDDTANNRFIISWEDIEHYGFFPTGDGATFQIHLYPSGAIELHYADLVMGDPTFNDGASATIGIQDVDGAADLDELQLSCNTADPTLEGTALVILGCTDGDGDGFCDTDDCDDTNSAIYPGAPEVCDDSIDDDCDGSDEGSDDDLDFYIDVACGGDDCDDDDDEINPGVDEDGDGFSICDDCNDSLPLGAFINPGEEEICDDGVDNNCSGFDEVGDEDLDTYINVACGGDDCDDLDAAVNPGVNVDGDGYNACEDCDDDDDEVNPDAEEICDGIDNDCDEITDDVDEDGDGEFPFECGGDDCDDSDPLLSPNVDADNDLVDSCADCNDDDDSIYPGAEELCDGVDQDCDGLPDGQDFDTGSGVAPFEEIGPGPSVLIDDLVTVTSTQTVATGGTLIVDLDVSLDITHTWASDLTVTLEAPSGTVITLFDGVGGSGNNFTDTVLDDEATDLISLCDVACIPFTGSYIPQDALSAFDGEDPNGDWTLSVFDSANGDTGTVNEWTLTFEFVSPDDQDGDGWVNTCPDYGGDCDDTDATIFPGAPEICSDEIDQDCDGIDQTGDEDDDTYIDADCGGDDCDDNDPDINPGVDADADGSNACEDCDDDNADNFPDNPETCDDGIDQNCDGADDIGDQDGDGYTNEACIGGDDCDDTDAFFNPGLDQDGDGSNFCLDCDDSDDLRSPDYEEICGDFIDNDCNDEIDDGADEDEDGFGSCDDCDDDDATVNPDAEEICDDGLDNDCSDGDLLSDVDGDGYVNANCGDEADDCDDEDAAFHPGADEFCDGIDLNCDGETTEVDEDGDGYYDLACGGTDCDDDAQSIHPDLPELCNGVDDNCDGELHPEGEEDLDEDGVPVCDGDCDDEDELIYPGATELCDGLDNDCDGEIDNGLVRDGDSDNHEREDCGGDDCDDGNPLVSPSATEDCVDGVDNDCDGDVDADDEDCEFGGGSDCDCNSSFAGQDRSVGLAGLLLLVGLGLRRRRSA
jgi:MYXO-CTERM domain-containing protein